MLSDRHIRMLMCITDNRLVIDPLPEDQDFQPASVDLKLGQIDSEDWTLQSNDWTLQPNDFRLASTLELVSLPDNICGQVVGKSTWARRGLIVEAAGLVDPGFCGQLTLEMFNMSQKPITLTPNTRICQIAFFKLSSSAKRLYGDQALNSHYQNQRGPTQAFGGDV